MSIFLLAMLGWIVSLFKKSGVAKWNFGISLSSFILFMIVWAFIDTDGKVTEIPDTNIQLIVEDTTLVNNIIAINLD